MGSRRDDEDDVYEDRPARRGFRCPYCGSTEAPVVRSKISTAGWVTFAVLLLVCLPLFWIGLLMKEDYRECHECGIKIGG